MPKEFYIPSISTRPLRVIQHHEGGFGRVYIVTDDEGTRYALKTLKWELEFNKYELAEEVLKLINIPPHPNVIQVKELHWKEDIPYILMSYYPNNLRTDISNYNQLISSQIKSIVKQVANALYHLHNKSHLLHLDLKPENILKSSEGNYLVSDFGIAQQFPATQTGDFRSHLYLSGFVGTIAYMSPEQLVSKSLTTKCDIFSYGIILYELLTGIHPFIGSSIDETVRNILLKEIKFKLKQKLSIPSSLRDLCLACLQKNPNNRPSSEQLANVLNQSPHEYNITNSNPYTFELESTINKANTLMGIGNLSEAKQLLESCVNSNPWYITARINLAHVYFEEGNVNKAVNLAKETMSIYQWTEVSRDSIVTLFTNLSNYYLSIDPSESIKYSRNSMELDPYDWQALGNFAEACRVLGDSENDISILQEGRQAIEKALEINPEDVKLRTTYGGILLELNDHETLHPLLIKLINEVGEHDIASRFLLIKTLIRTGQIDDAERWLEPMRSIEYLKGYISQLDNDIIERKRELSNNRKE